MGPCDSESCPLNLIFGHAVEFTVELMDGDSNNGGGLVHPRPPAGPYTLSSCEPRRERDASACIRRHHAFGLPPVCDMETDT